MSEAINALLDALEPREVFSKFRLLTLIPRGSGNEQAISDFLRDWARKKGFAVRQDNLHNLLIKKPGVNADPNAPAVILQAHLDMVCVSEPGYDFDFSTQPVRVRVDGDSLSADRTTLGADNGIGVALALALLDSDDVAHPPLEVVLTTNEEVGLTGAAGFDVSDLNGKYFINIDSDEEGIFYASCAGGVRLNVVFPVESVPVSCVPDENECTGLRLSVSGLKGGHSGMEIDKERGNSHRLAARVLRQLVDDYGVRMHAFDGGMADNAIPAATEAVLVVRKRDLDAIGRDVRLWEDTFRNELKASDGKPDADGVVQRVTVAAKSCPLPEWVLVSASLEKMLFALLVIPTGVSAMDLNRPEQLLPEASSNLAIVALSATEAIVRVGVRSQLSSRKAFIRTQIESIATVLGGTVTGEGDYPGWEYTRESLLRSLCARVYERQTGRAAAIVGTHAGLECGLFSDKAKACGKTVDFTSFGPNLHAIHTPVESASISSTARCWELLKEIVAELAKNPQ